MTTLLYLHGFLSSPESLKAQLTKAYFTQHFPQIRVVIPELPNSPTELRYVLEKLITEEKLAIGEGVNVIGSSMGGYLATWFVETCGGKAVLINPAVRPYELLVDYFGPHVNPYTNVKFSLNEKDMERIKALDTPSVRQSKNYKVLLQTGDETLNYQEAEHKYSGANMTIEDGGDHSFVDYEKHLPAIALFLFDRAPEPT